MVERSGSYLAISSTVGRDADSSLIYKELATAAAAAPNRITSNKKEAIVPNTERFFLDFLFFLLGE